MPISAATGDLLSDLGITDPSGLERSSRASSHVPYLGEINSSEELAWRRSHHVIEEGEPVPRSLELFSEDRCEGLLPAHGAGGSVCADSPRISMA
jgi:hypothetical protein